MELAECMPLLEEGKRELIPTLALSYDLAECMLNLKKRQLTFSLKPGEMANSNTIWEVELNAEATTSRGK